VGDQAHIREIYEASYRRLVTQMYGITGDRQEAEDSVQEAFARAVAAEGRFRRTDNPEAWLRTVALNVIRRRWRRARMFGGLAPRLASPSAAPGISDDHVAVIEALRAVPAAHREVLALFYLGDLTVQQVAESLGIPEGTVKSRLNRGRDMLSTHLAVTTESDHD
jgi:RNA polymerase sigma-70 factor (ECF subfamily)